MHVISISSEKNSTNLTSLEVSTNNELLFNGRWFKELCMCICIELNYSFTNIGRLLGKL
jgi:hypothetical protein